jgi:hypothetical protein
MEDIEDLLDLQKRRMREQRIIRRTADS